MIITTTLSMEAHNSPPPSPPPKTYKLTASSISFIKPTAAAMKLPFLFNSCTSTTSAAPTYILRDVSLFAYPSQILAVVGPSGAGKSTLLDILASRTSPTSGTLLLNSSPVNPSTFRKLSAYVPQHDACLPLLTVSETFAFAASLLLPTSSSSVTTAVTSLLADLRLTHLADTMLSRGLSGGERRRVSIGLSLLHDPGILILDEPTSGLDSRSAYNVILSIKGIAEARRRTVVLSIHQPSFRILSCIDSILLLNRGTVVHHGTMGSLEHHLGCIGFAVPLQLNALEYAMEILSRLQETVKPAAPADDDVDDWRMCAGGGGGDGWDNAVVVRYKSSRVREIGILFSRSWKMIYRTKQLLLANVLEALGVGLVLGTVYFKIGYDKQGIQKRLGLFAFTLTFLLSSASETLPIFINERPILLRETTSGLYRLSSYLIANTLVFLPYLLAVALIYSASVYFLAGLCSTFQAFAYFVLVIWTTVLTANSFVLFLSSLAPNYIAGTSLVTVLLSGFFLFSGYFISKGSMPKYWILMHFFSMYKYAFDGMLINEYSCLASRCLAWYGDDHENMSGCMVTGRDVMEKRGLHEGMRWVDVCALIGFFVFYRVLCFLVLRRRISRSGK